MPQSLLPSQIKRHPWILIPSFCQAWKKRVYLLKSVNPKQHYLRNIIPYLIIYIERFLQCELAEFKYAVFSKNSAKRGNIMQ